MAILRYFKASDFEKALSLGVAGLDGVSIGSNANGDAIYRLSNGKAELLELTISAGTPPQSRLVELRIAKFGFTWAGEIGAIQVFLPDHLEPCGKGIMSPSLLFRAADTSAESLSLSFCSHDEVIGLQVALMRQFGTFGELLGKFDSPDDLHEREKRPEPPPISTPRRLELLDLKDWQNGR